MIPHCGVLAIAKVRVVFLTLAIKALTATNWWLVNAALDVYLFLFFSFGTLPYVVCSTSKLVLGLRVAAVRSHGVALLILHYRNLRLVNVP